MSEAATAPAPRANPDLVGHEAAEAGLRRLFEGGRLPHARSQGSCPCTLYDHRGAPVFMSNATTDFK